MKRWSKPSTILTSAVALLILLGKAPGASAGSTSCSSSNQCPKSSPCCGPSGTCGSGALQCADGCSPLASFTPGSCQPNPICVDKNVTLVPSNYNDPHTFWPILLYDGNATKAPFTLDYGSLGKGPEGVLLQLTAATQTRISSTDYMLYGSIELSARHDALAGLVFAFITMSDVKDEIDWEFTTSNPQDLQTNYFSQAKTAPGTAANITAPSKAFNVSDWHTYGLNWQPNILQWLVDGKVVRSVSRSKAGKNFPRSPSRVQVSVWAGGNSTNGDGVIDWAGGPIDWTSSTYTSQGYYSAEIRSFQQKCASPNIDTSISTVGSGSSITSWVYTGNTSETLDMPEYVLSTDPIEYLANGAADGLPNMPGYQTQTPFTKANSNAWDGSGTTSGLSKEQKGGAAKGSVGQNTNDGVGTSDSDDSNSGGWLNNNRTLSIAVPIVAGGGVLVALWALLVCCSRRRRRKATEGNTSGGIASEKNYTEFHGVRKQPIGQSIAAAVASRVPRRSDTRYEALNGAQGNEEDIANAIAPMGAKRIGRGYGPSSGPIPGPMTRYDGENYQGSNVSSTAYSGAPRGDKASDYHSSYGGSHHPAASQPRFVDSYIRVATPRTDVAAQGDRLMAGQPAYAATPRPRESPYAPSPYSTASPYAPHVSIARQQYPQPGPYQTGQLQQQHHGQPQKWGDYSQKPQTRAPQQSSYRNDRFA